MVSDTRSSTMWSPNHAVISMALSSASGIANRAVSSMADIGGTPPAFSDRLITGESFCDGRPGISGGNEVIGWRSHQVGEQPGDLLGDVDAKEAKGGNRDDPGLPASPAHDKPAEQAGCQHEGLSPKEQRYPGERLCAEHELRS